MRPSYVGTFAAAKSFGKFKDSFLAELHAEIASHQESSGMAPQPVQGIVVHDSEVLAPEPVRQGGLMRKDAVRLSSRITLIWSWTKLSRAY